MTNLDLTLPTISATFDKQLIKPSKEFRQQVFNVVNSIVMFIIVYLLLLVAAIVIAGLMGFIGYLLIIDGHIFIVSILGFGLMLSGAMLVFFLVKFLFAKSPDTGKRYEITESHQPELFNFIRQLTIETGAPFPKHIYLTPEVNASVFFDSSFWSMFFPVKKNLNIGMALVNSTNQSEFRAILAHEFGHFSQRSMRFGSYVYSFNKVVYNILYQNNSYERMLHAWARWHAVLRLSAKINIKIVKLIQQILKEMYVDINKSYLGLSREMEFHADTIAACYCGSNNTAKALYRVEVANSCYNVLINFLNRQLNNGYRSTNIYPQHTFILKQFAIEHHLTTDENGIPIINKGISSLRNSRVTIQDQWASHPTTNDRQENVNNIAITIDPVTKPAWSLFKNIDLLQEYFTEKLYTTVKNYQELKVIETDFFQKTFEDEVNENSYNKAYKGFYNSRLINVFDVDAAVADTPVSQQITFENLFNDENCNLPKAIAGMHSDIALLDSIINDNNNDSKNFDFKGIKYEQPYAFQVKTELIEECETAGAKLANLDKDTFVFFLQITKNEAHKQSLIDQYKKMFEYQDSSAYDHECYNNVMVDINPIYSRMNVGTIYDTLAKVYETEKTVKEQIRKTIATEENIAIISETQKQQIETYLSNKWIYYLEPSYDKKAIEIFNKGMNAYISIINERNFQQKKALFDFQLTLLK